MLDDYNLQCFVENKQQCNVKASSWPENKFAKLEEATYSINSLNTGYCFFKALNSLSAGIVKALSEKMASSRNDFKVFCTEDFLKTKIQPSDLNILKQKYGLETYIDQCKFSAIPAALLGCPMNLDVTAIMTLYKVGLILNNSGEIYSSKANLNDKKQQ